MGGPNTGHGTFETCHDTEKSDFRSLGWPSPFGQALSPAAPGACLKREWDFWAPQTKPWARDIRQTYGSRYSPVAHLSPTSLWWECGSPLPAHEESKAWWCLGSIPPVSESGQVMHRSVWLWSLWPRGSELLKGDWVFAVLAHTPSPELPPACVIQVACAQTLSWRRTLFSPRTRCSFRVPRGVRLLPKTVLETHVAVVGCYRVKWPPYSRWRSGMLDTLNTTFSCTKKSLFLQDFQMSLRTSCNCKHHLYLPTPWTWL